MNLAGFLFLIVCSLWVLIDARAIGVRPGLVKGLGNMGPGSWSVLTFMIWIIAFPCYLYYRPKFKRAVAAIRMSCARCGQEMEVEAAFCPACGAPRGASPGGSTADVLPADPPLSRWSVAAFYCGLCSILVLPAPFAIVTGVLGLREIARTPGMRGRWRAIFGICVGGVIALLFLIGILTKSSAPLK